MINHRRTFMISIKLAFLTITLLEMMRRRRSSLGFTTLLQQQLLLTTMIRQKLLRNTIRRNCLYSVRKKNFDDHHSLNYLMSTSSDNFLDRACSIHKYCKRLKTNVAFLVMIQLSWMFLYLRSKELRR